MKSEIKQEVNDFLKEIRKLDFFPQIEFVILYGSYLNKYHYDESDIDLCIYIQEEEKTLARIRLSLLEKFEDKFDIQMFQLLPIYIQIEVLKGEVLYVKDEDLLYEIAYKAIEEYEDFSPFYLDYINR